MAITDHTASMSGARWLEISVEAPGELAAPLADLFSKHSGGSVAVEKCSGRKLGDGESPSGSDIHVIVRAWLPVDATLDDRIANVDLGVRLLSHERQLPPVRKTEVFEAEWRRRTFDPVRVGQRLLVVPANGVREDPAATDSDFVTVPLEPGLAFGTGRHPTTRTCLEVVERVVRRDESIVDIGCGSGILTIAALKLGGRNAVCFDIDPDAVRAAGRNLRRAGLNHRAIVVQGTVPHPAAPLEGFDLVFANTSARVLIEQAMPMFKCLQPTGTFIGSGYTVDRMAEVHRALRKAGATIRETIVSSDWVTVLAGPTCAPDRDCGGTF